MILTAKHYGGKASAQSTIGYSALFKNFMTTASQPALFQVLLAAARVISQVLQGESQSQSLTQVPAHLRAAVQAHSFYSLRQLGLAQCLAKDLVRKQPKEPVFNGLLLQSLALLNAAVQYENNPSAAPAHLPLYTTYTLVDQAVQAAQSQRALRPFKNLLNAVLRRFIREHDALLTKALQQPQARWNYPSWWIKQLQAAYPQQWQAIVQASQTPAPLTLRVNRRRCTAAQLMQALKDQHIPAWSAGGPTVVLAQAKPVQQLPGFDQGWWSVQDSSAQLAGQLLPIADGMRVLDACAAPGGKTAHLLEQADIQLVALDVDAQRLERVQQNLHRLGLEGPQVQLLAAPAQDLDAWWDGTPFEAILADVPCTASGIVRRHPDIPWLRRQSDLAATAALQQQIVQQLWTTLAPGGHLLYVTCSIFPIEGQQQIAQFLRTQTDAVLLPESPMQRLPTLETPNQAGGDGFFYALLQKQST